MYAASREIFLEGRLMHIAFEAIVGICTVIVAVFKLIETVAKTIIMIVDRVRANKRKK